MKTISEMKEELSRILIHITSAIYLVNAETSYHVTTFTEDVHKMHTTNTPRDYLQYKNISIQSSVIALPTVSGLSSIISAASNASAKNLTAENEREVIHLSHLTDKRKKILQEIFGNTKLISSDVTKCSQILDEDLKMYSSCGKYRTIYADALTTLIHRTFVHAVMIVVDQEPCSQRFASILKNFTYSQASNSKLPLFHFVNDSSDLLSNLSSMFYKATVKSVTTIILLCSDYLIELIFRRAISSAIPYSNILWVAIDYSSAINDTLAPSLLLSVSHRSGIDSNSAVLNNNSNKILATKAIASLAVEDKVITKLDAIELVKGSLKETPEPSCIIKNVEASAVLVSLRQSKFIWTSLYTVGSDNKVTQLVEDKKLSWLSRIENHKAKILVTTIQEPPFVIVIPNFYQKKANQCSQGILCRIPNTINNATVWTFSCCLGSIMDLLKKLQEDLWLAIDLHVVEDGLFGSIVNGKWNGMVGELVNRKADMALATLTSTTKRSAVVDFGESYMQVSLGILVASDTVDEMKFFNFSFVANVTGNLLLVLLFMFIFGLMVLYATENIINRQKQCKKNAYALRESFSYLSGLTFQRDLGGKNPVQGSTRIMFIIFAFGMVIIMTTYTATLTAVQVKQENNNVLTGFKDPKLTDPTESYKYATIKSSSMQEYFRFSENTVYRMMNAFMEKYNVRTTEEGAQKVLSGQLKALIIEYPVAQYIASKQTDCSLQAIKTNNGKSNWNVAFQKNSPWKEMISKKILQYKEKGFFDDITTRWMKTSCTDKNAINLTSQKYKIENFSGLLVIFGCVLIISIIILIIESWIFKWKKKSSEYSFER